MAGLTPRAQAGMMGLLNVAIAVAVLHLGQDFLRPVVLALLLSFLLAPVNRRLERMGAGRVGSVLITMAGVFAVVGGLVLALSGQMMDLAKSLPGYKSNLVAKAQALRMSETGAIGMAVQTIKEVAQSAGGEAVAVPGKAAEPQKEKPLEVEVVPSASDTLVSVTASVSPIFSPLGTAAIVLLVAVFMMMGREDLRDRIVHLLGRSRYRINTGALDEVGERVSGYLFAQLMVNVAYGVPLAVGLYFIGVPNAVLFGLFAVVLRFLPYLGPWIAAVFPVLLSLAVSDSWWMVGMTVGLFVALELVSNNVVEPLVYGARTGLSPLAVVVSAFFWTWLWGLAGLILATPLTVCLVVLGKHMPQLRFAQLLLSDKPPITHGDRLYHRLLTNDADDAATVLERMVEDEKLAGALDQCALPALWQLESDALDETVSEEKHTRALRLLQQLVVELGADAAAPVASANKIACVPAGEKCDEIACEMLSVLLRERGYEAEVFSSALTSGEMAGRVAAVEPTVICVCSAIPQTAAAAAYVIRKLHQQAPEARIVAALLQEQDGESDRRKARVAKVTQGRITATLAATSSAVAEALPPPSRIELPPAK